MKQEHDNVDTTVLLPVEAEARNKAPRHCDNVDVTVRMPLKDAADATRPMDTEASGTAKTDESSRGRTVGTFSDVMDYFHHRVFRREARTASDLAKCTIAGAQEKITDLGGFALPDDELLPKVNAQYEVFKRFAEGGQGVLFRARDKVLRRIIALKALRPELHDDQNVRRAFVNEALITAQLEHPAIVSIYSLMKDDDDGLVLSMKLVHGQTLDELLLADASQFKNNLLSRWGYNEILHYHLELFLRICDAIAYAHSRGIIHCDLKPENIMLGEYGEVYVMDWGIAKKLSENGDVETTADKPLDGTPRFMPQEVFCGKPRDVRTDIYALGMILYEIVCLQRAFDKDDIKAIVNEIRQGARKPVENKYGVPLHPALVAIVNKATAHSPEQRYQTVSQLAGDIRHYIHDEPTIARPDNVCVTIGRFVRRHARGMVLTAMFGWFIAFLMTSLSLHQVKAMAQREREAAALQAKIKNHANGVLKYGHTIGEMNTCVMRSALALSDQLNEIAKRLSNVVDLAGHLYELPPHPDEYGFIPVFDYMEYQRRDARVMGQYASQPYNFQFINPDVASYVVPYGTQQAEYAEALEKMKPVTLTLYRLVLSSSGDFVKGHNGDREVKAKMLTQGLLIRRAYVGLENNGLQIAYPFNPEYERDYDNRKRPWYKVTRQSFEDGNRNAPVWGKPYLDAGKNSRRYLLACTLPILDEDGEFIGVAGADIHFEFLMDIIIRNGNGFDEGVEEKFLVNLDGDTLCRVDMREPNGDIDNLLNSEFKLSRRIFTHILNVRKAGYGAIDNTSIDDKYIYHFAFLPNSQLCIVEKCSRSVVRKRLGITPDD